MWSIWFCHELLQDHETVLKNALKELLIYSVDPSQWSSSENPLHAFVTFFSLSTLKEIRKYWSIWYNEEIKISVEDMRIARLKSQKRKLPDIDIKVFQGMHEIFGLLGRSLYEDKFDTMSKEYRAYLESGSVFGEHVVELSDPLTTDFESERTVNLTFYEKEDGTYSLHFCSVPYRCFHQRYVYNFSKMKKSGFHISECGVKIDQRKFLEFPMLASSFQQFLAWILGSAYALQNNKSRISFILDTSDAFQFSHSWESEGKHRVNLVFASNLIDSVSPAAIVLTATRLLSNNGLFVSATTRYRLKASNFNEYIEASFGISSSLLPLVCGVRCVNHEGDKYSSSISHQHVPIDLNEIDKHFTSIYESTFIWKRVSMTSLCTKSIELLPEVCQALCNSFKVSCTALSLSCMEPRNNYSCTDSSILILKKFAERLNPSLAKSHDFWSHLCTCFKANKDLQPFLTSIQTQAIINGIHLHLLIDESTCPICRKLPISSYIAQFCIEVNSVLIQDFVMVRLEKHSHSQYIDCLSRITSDPSKVKLFL